MPATMSMRLPDEVALRLGDLATATGRTKSYLALQAIQDYIDKESWQVAEIQQAIKEADSGDFVTPDEMKAIDEKWKARGHAG